MPAELAQLEVVVEHVDEPHSAHQREIRTYKAHPILCASAMSTMARADMRPIMSEPHADGRRRWCEKRSERGGTKKYFVRFLILTLDKFVFTETTLLTHSSRYRH